MKQIIFIIFIPPEFEGTFGGILAGLLGFEVFYFKIALRQYGIGVQDFIQIDHSHGRVSLVVFKYKSEYVQEIRAVEADSLKRLAQQLTRLISVHVTLAFRQPEFVAFHKIELIVLLKYKLSEQLIWRGKLVRVEAERNMKLLFAGHDLGPIGRQIIEYVESAVAVAFLDEERVECEAVGLLQVDGDGELQGPQSPLPLLLKLLDCEAEIARLPREAGANPLLHRAHRREQRPHVNVEYWHKRFIFVIESPRIFAHRREPLNERVAEIRLI